MKRLFCLLAATALAAPTPLNNFALVLPFEQLEWRLNIEERNYYMFVYAAPEVRAYFAGRASVYREQIEMLRMQVPQEGESR